MSRIEGQDNNNANANILYHLIIDRALVQLIILPGIKLTILRPTEDQIQRPFLWFHGLQGCDISIELGPYDNSPINVIGEVGGGYDDILGS